MTLADLKAKKEDFGSEWNFLTRYLDAYNRKRGLESDRTDDPLDIFLTEARQDIYNDIDATRRYEWDVYNDSITDPAATGENDFATPAWRRILALKQLALVYKEEDNGVGSLTHTNRKEYERQYAAAVAGVHTIVTGVGTLAVTTRRMRL